MHVLGLRFCARAFSSCGERGHSSSRCAGLSLSRPLLLRSTGSRRAGSVVVAHGPSRSAACGIFPDQGSNPCPLHWQKDSQPLRHQGSAPYGWFNSRIQNLWIRRSGGPTVTDLIKMGVDSLLGYRLLILVHKADCTQRFLILHLVRSHWYFEISLCGSIYPM